MSNTTADSYVAKIKLNGKTFPISPTLKGTCNTSGWYTTKFVSLQNFDIPIDGADITVKFTYGNRAINPTLKINNTPAYPIYAHGNTPPGNTPETSWYNGSVITFMFDGTSNAWIMKDWSSGDTGDPNDHMVKIYNDNWLSSYGGCEWRIVLSDGYYTYAHDDEYKIGYAFDSPSVQVDGYYYKSDPESSDCDRMTPALLLLDLVRDYDPGTEYPFDYSKSISISRKDIRSTSYFEDSQDHPTSFKSVGDMAAAIDNINTDIATWDDGVIRSGYFVLSGTNHEISESGYSSEDLSRMLSNIDTLQSDMSSAQSDISNLQNDMGTAQSDISNLQGVENLAYEMDNDRIYVIRGDGIIGVVDLANTNGWDSGGQYTSLKACLEDVCRYFEDDVLGYFIAGIDNGNYDISDMSFSIGDLTLDSTDDDIVLSNGYWDGDSGSYQEPSLRTIIENICTRLDNIEARLPS